MKKVITAILAIALLAALALPAMGDAFTLYTTKSGVRVYAKKSTSSKVYKKLSKGEKLLIEKKSGKWYAILVESASGDGQTLGWVQAKYLSSTKPSKAKRRKGHNPAPTKKPKRLMEQVLGTMQDVSPYDAEVVTRTERGTVALRRQPTTDGQLITHLMNGAMVKVLAEGEDWFQVSDMMSGITGYMASAYIARASEVADAEADEAADAAQDAEADEAADAVQDAEVDEATDAAQDAAADETADEATDAAQGGRTVAPIAVALDVNQLPDGEYPASFEPGDVARLASGTLMNAVHIYAMDLYAEADIDGLAAGDTVVVAGETVAVMSVARDGDTVLINGGLGEAEGCEFIRTEDGSFRINGENDQPTWSEVGVTTLTVDESVAYTDAADIEAEPVSADYDGLIDALQGTAFQGFYAENTTLTLRSGRVVRIDRAYMP